MPRGGRLGRVAVPLAAAVVGWRVAALVLLHLQPQPAAGPLLVSGLLAVVGLTFIVCGLLVLWRRPGRASRLFAGYCLCAGLHWGGPLELPPGQLRSGLILLYLLLSSFLGEALFLHFALTFPRQSRLARVRALVRGLYAPLAIGAVLAVVYLASPAGGERRAFAEGLFFLLHAGVSNLFAVLALALFVTRLVRPGVSGRERRWVGVMVASLLLAWLPYVVASAAGVADTDPWNLPMAVLPLGFAAALLVLGGERRAVR